MEDKVLFLKSDNPLYTYPDNVKFDDYYQKHSSMKIQISKQNGKKIFINNSKDNKCCFCGIQDNGRNFTHKAHIVPASYGNKTYFSNDECNECNEKFGNEYESELSQMFLLERLLNNIPSRNNKPPKYKNNLLHGSSIENLGLNTLLFINNEDQLFLNFISSINNQMNENADGIQLHLKYKPINVVKSLIHTMWLLFDEDTRKSNKNLLDWFLGKIDIFPLYLNYGNIKQLNNNIVTFTIWEKYNKKDNSYADFILVFTFSNNVVLFEVPCLNISEYKPCILPPLIIETNMTDNDLSMTRIEIKSNDQIVDDKKIFGYEKLESASRRTIDIKGVKEINKIKDVILADRELLEIKKYIIEINIYYKICIPFCINLDTNTRNHINNITLCILNNGKSELKYDQLKIVRHKSLEKIINKVNNEKPPLFKQEVIQVFDYGSGKISYKQKIEIKNPSCRLGRNKLGIDFVTFQGKSIKVETTL
jgi:hypothetical protein